MIVDIRKGSPTAGRNVALELSARDGTHVWVPPGFLHGFCTLEDHTEVLYKVTEYYSAIEDAGIAWNDPDPAVAWPVDAAVAILSDKDRHLPRLRDLPIYFHYESSGCTR